MTYSPDDLPENGPIVLAIGKKSRGKGAGVLMFAMWHVRHVIPDAMLVLLGKPADLPIPDYPWLWNVDSVPKDEVPAWIDAARVVCCPSFMDGFPRALLEAMAQGRACVGTTGTGGMDEMIVDGVTGYLVPKGDPVALADALIKALDLDTAIRMGVAGYKRVHGGALYETTSRSVEPQETTRGGWTVGDFMLLPLLAGVFIVYTLLWPFMWWSERRG